MLLNLYVKNLALIDEMEVSFEDGLNILTGETGAGKSVIIGSINYALGGKMSKEAIGKYDDYGYVELIFSVDNDNTKKELESMDIDLSEEQIIISRKISNGKSIIKVNGESWTATKLKELTSKLIDIHGQHDHESLLHRSKHNEILDEFAGHRISGVLCEYYEKYKEYKSLLDRLSEFNMDEDARIREISFTEYELNEIEEAALRPGEDEELELSYKVFSNQGKIFSSLGNAINALSEDEVNASSMISAALKELSMVSEYDEKLKQIHNSVMDLDAICSDAVREISDYINNVSYDQEKADNTLKRLDLINKLKLKHGNSIESILDKEKKLTEKLNELTDYENAKKELEKNISECERQLRCFAEKLTKIRKEAAKELEKSIVSILMDLNFLEVRFKVSFEETEDFTKNGRDIVEFLISTNPGEELKPLKDIASGGELSRIMLGIKTILAGKDDIDTLIFDEIDAGISGRTAQLVSEKLNIISREHQVICITHLPQIAAMADAHFIIEKNVVDDKTKTGIKRLDREGEVLELARMLGGAVISETVVENAREMKEFTRKNKNIQNL